MILGDMAGAAAENPGSSAAGQELRTFLKPLAVAAARLGLGATRMNNLRMLRTRLDNAQRPLPRSRTDLNGSGRPRWYLRISPW
jgi:hypothetical protein